MSVANVIAKERPILFSGPMVRAILNGSKTQTRRVVKFNPATEIHCVLREYGDHDAYVLHGEGEYHLNCPYGRAGDQLWVRETFGRATILRPFDLENIKYRADDEADDAQRWRPSIHMPRWASRITLEITGVRVEQLQDISDADAMAEGILRKSCGRDLWCYEYSATEDAYDTAPESYRALWESINGSGSWALNPWVWVIEFRRIKP